MRRDAATTGLNAAQAAAAERGLKGMIPDDRGRPFLDHVISSLADAGISDVCLVIGTDHDAIREHFALRPPRRVRVSFAVQHEPTGTADALLCSESWTQGDDFLALNADNLYPTEAIRALVDGRGPGVIAFDRDALVRESNIAPARIGAFAILSLRDDDTLAGIVEKPGDDYAEGTRSSPLISMNIWRFDRDFFSACRDVPLSPRGEHELPLAVALAISRGMTFRAIRISAGVLDLSISGDIANVADRLGATEIDP